MPLETPMSDKLLNIIKDRIRQEGPIDLGTYMELCLGHPEHGYYMTRDPFGAAGDFTTSPEVSQLFGEMIGAWLADVWINMGSPSRFALLECGPGRGTLMADILRATKHVFGFHDAAKIYMMEMSPVLQELQKQKLEAYNPYWISDVTQLDSDVPVLLIANEFLDALPVRQFVKMGESWQERRVALSVEGSLVAGEFDVACVDLEKLPADDFQGVFETSLCLNQFIRSINILLKKQSGAALFVDYGHVKSGAGDTLQAMKRHKFVDIFETPGICDLTAHVDFENIVRIAKEDDVAVYGPVTQSAFLKSLGIGARAERLWAGANEVQRESIISGLNRLIDTEQMGSLFKIIALCHGASICPEGFDESI